MNQEGLGNTINLLENTIAKQLVIRTSEHAKEHSIPLHTLASFSIITTKKDLQASIITHLFKLINAEGGTLEDVAHAVTEDLFTTIKTQVEKYLQIKRKGE